MKITRPTRVELVGRGKTTINPADHVATGGEGSVYLIGKTIIKLYSDLSKMLRDNMAGKIEVLAKFAHPYIVAPQGLTLDSSGRAIGFYMAYAEGEPFARMFTNKFRKRTGFDDKDASILADRMLDAFKYAHDQTAVLADPNELNWIGVLLGANGPEPRVMDVDGWALGAKWPARAVMLSIRDFHTKDFTVQSDMFAWGVVSFQMYTGIHPYKGELPGYDMAELERRMRENASVFSKDVMLPMAVRDFGCIPGPLLNWYEATFQQGERTSPPSPFDTGITVPARQVKIARVVTTVTGKLRYARLLGDADPALRIFPCGVVLLESGDLYDLGAKRVIGKADSRNCEVARVEGGWLVGEPNHRDTTFTFINSTNYQPVSVEPPVRAATLVRYDNRMFLVAHGGLTEVKFRKFGANPILAAGHTFGAMPKSTEWFDGVGIQDTMGAKFLIAPFGDDACGQVRTRELDGHRVVAAKAGHRFVSVIAIDTAGQYQRFEFTLDRTYNTYSVWQGPALNAELNLTLVPRGQSGVVGATIARDGELTIFVPSTGTVNKLADKDITTAITLANWNESVVFIRDGQVWSLTMT
jgi:hypothetical protein